MRQAPLWAHVCVHIWLLLLCTHTNMYMTRVTFNRLSRKGWARIFERVAAPCNYLVDKGADILLLSFWLLSPYSRQIIQDSDEIRKIWKAYDYNETSLYISWYFHFRETSGFFCYWIKRYSFIKNYLTIHKIKIGFKNKKLCIIK